MRLHIRTIVACILLSFICCMIPISSAEFIIIEIDEYELYYDEMLGYLVNGYYEDALIKYDEIIDIWPDSVDRAGSCDDYALYAKGMVALSDKRYAVAQRSFAALDDDFPSGYDNLFKASALKLYAEGYSLMLSGDNAKAMDAFYACRGTLDASTKYEELLTPPEQHLSNCKASQVSATSVSLTWLDEKSRSAYYLTCAPDGVRAYTDNQIATSRSAVFSDLIPDTNYVISIMPDTDEACLPLIFKFTTPKATGKPGHSISLRSARLYSYDAQIAKSMGIDIITRMINNGISSSYCALVEDNETISLPYAYFEYANKSYLFFYSLSHATSDNKRYVNVKIVLRPSSGGAYAVTDTLSLLNSDCTGQFVQLGALLDMAYSNEEAWSEGYAGLEIYVNDALIDKRYIKLTA